MTQSLLLFTFGPVQLFIAEARRGQDLYAGSRILSELSRAALKGLQKHGTPIYPLPDAADVPNKLVVEIATDAANQAGAEAIHAFDAKWAEFVEDALHEVQSWGAGQKPDGVWQTIWDRQTKADLVWDRYWVAAPLKDNYGETYRHANTLLDAVKRARPFQPSEESGLKDSLSGKRSALHTQAGDAKTYWKGVSGVRGIAAAKLRPNGKECLDAIGVIKRFGLKAVDDIPSVSTVATEAWLTKARDKSELNDFKSALKEWGQEHRVDLDRRNASNGWPYDGDLFFLETLTPSRFEDSYGTKLDESQFAGLKRALRVLHKANDGPPSPYYAVLALDGDSMGKKIDGCKIKEAHTQFSADVNTFADGVRATVKEQNGFTVYAGGDDVLALLPLEKAIETARQLAKTFKEKVGNTASAGLCIAHHLSPLAGVLQEARAAESDAKHIEDGKKDALAIRVLKRSGETLSVRAKWEWLSAFDSVVDAFKSDKLSAKLGYDVRAIAHTFAPQNPAEQEHPTDLFDKDSRRAAFEAELARLVKRHAARGWEPEELIAALKTFAGQLPDVEALADWLLTARFIGQGGAE